MCKVTFDEFSQRFADEINFNLDAAKDLKLNEIPEYDSMGKINISLLIEEIQGRYGPNSLFLYF